jgi:hypothetical protein
MHQLCMHAGLVEPPFKAPLLDAAAVPNTFPWQHQPPSAAGVDGLHLPAAHPQLAFSTQAPLGASTLEGTGPTVSALAELMPAPDDG